MKQARRSKSIREFTYTNTQQCIKEGKLRKGHFVTCLCEEAPITNNVIKLQSPTMTRSKSEIEDNTTIGRNTGFADYQRGMFVITYEGIYRYLSIYIILIYTIK